jgi:uncharacterized protein (TIGR02594 family)
MATVWKILGMLPWGKILEFILGRFSGKDSVKDSLEKSTSSIQLNNDWLEIAKKEIGVKEVPGSGNNDRILQYHRATSLKATQDSVPWCSSFVCWVMERAGYVSTRSARARSWEHWGEALTEPKEGAIAVLWRKNPQSGAGHVGWYCGEKDGKIKLLGGNQNNSVNYSWYPKERVLSYRWPDMLA